MTIDPATAIGALTGIKTGIDLLRATLGLVKDAKDVLPEGDKKEAITKSVEAAERQILLAEVQVAQSLGYQLCQCTFPPQIMLSVGRHARGIERFSCPRCSKLEPSDEYFRQLDAVDRYNAGLREPDWIAARR